MKRTHTIKKIIRASVLFILLIIQVIVLQSDAFDPETTVAVYLVDVLKIFIYINLAWLILLLIRFLYKKPKDEKE